MSMFNWQQNDPTPSPSNPAQISPQPPSTVVSHTFWIYWAVSIPLTVAIGLGWRIWWQAEQRRYDQQIADAVEGTSYTTGS